MEKDVVPMDLLHGTLHSKGTYKLVYMEGAPKGRGRTGHLHVGVDEPYVEQPRYLPNQGIG